MKIKRVEIYDSKGNLYLECQYISLGIIKDFKEIMNRDSSKKEMTNDKIDKLLDLLIFSCDREEKELHNSIAMNEYIIKSDGDVMNAKKAYENDQDFLNDYLFKINEYKQCRNRQNRNPY